MCLVRSSRGDRKHRAVVCLTEVPGSGHHCRFVFLQLSVLGAKVLGVQTVENSVSVAK